MPVPNRDELYATYATDLQKLYDGLPDRFRETLKRVLESLPALFAEDWPMVPNHTDLLENNIHVDPATGRLTGVCDWRDATIGPFGTSLEGLDCLLGERSRSGWYWLPNQAELRRIFWQAFGNTLGRSLADNRQFRQRVDTARLVGVFRKHGLVYVDAENQAPVAEGSTSMNYLESVTLGLDSEIESWDEYALRHSASVAPEI